jgi:TonB family protein
VSQALSRPRHERHPVGLLLIIGLHVLLGLAMLSSRLRIDVLPISPVVAGQGLGQGVGTSTGAGRPEVRRARVHADAPQCQPVYPQVARMHHVAGSTRLRFTIDVAGRIVGVKVLGQSGPQAENRVLDSAAAEALSHCPAQVGIDSAGHAVGGTADIEYNWVLY